MENAGPEATMAEAGAQARGAVEEAKQRLHALNDRARSYIKAHPAPCLLGALAFGFVVARLARWRS